MLCPAERDAETVVASLTNVDDLVQMPSHMIGDQAGSLPSIAVSNHHYNAANVAFDFVFLQSILDQTPDVHVESDATVEQPESGGD